MSKWYQVSFNDNNLCGNCNKSFNGLAALDHHNSTCPNCNIDCIWFYFSDGITLQIIPKNAPSEFLSFINWAQRELDELEFLELIVSFEEIANSMNSM